MNTQRLIWIDWIKALAIIGVIAIHCTSAFLTNDYLFTLTWFKAVCCSSIFRYAIVLFIMASGVLLLRKNQPVTVIPRRLKRICVPFVFWLIVYAVIKVVVKDAIGPVWNIIDLSNFILRGFLDPIGVSIQFWYIYMIIGLYMLSPILSRWIQHSKLEEVEYFLIIWIIVSILQFIGLKTLLFDYLRYFTGAIGYFILGYYLTQTDNSYLKNPSFGLILLVAGLLITAIGTIISSYLMLSQSFFFIRLGDITPGSCLEAVGLFIIIYNSNLNNIPEVVTDYITRLSRDSYGIYMVNLLIVNIIYKLNLFDFEHFTVLMIIIMIIIVLLLSEIIIEVMDRIPILSHFSGRS